ncbi:MAG: UDP-3-O-[3-hydroxymyristoyl] N-acetylglucosamine deacetylase [Myxococcales bacterium]|nr:MAG: UDP-3-O-[3-hydroxymyristoyl] N-acetylglucosamine deacetylase [Myxococcales bacterium]
MTARRQTLAAPLTFSGIGVHTGAACRIRLVPFAGGIVFQSGKTRLPARVDFLLEAERGIVLSKDDVTVAVVEHLLSALAAFGVSDALIEVDGPELPFMDGSAAPFVEALLAGGLISLDTAASAPLIVSSPLEAREGERFVRVEPADRLEFDVAIDYPHPLIGKQRWAGPIDAATYRCELAPARSFGFLREHEALKQMGFARGASADNVLVFTEDAVLPGQTLRFPDEPARHKALDLLGDLALVGRPVVGRVVSFKGGHRLNAMLAAKLAKEA